MNIFDRIHIAGLNLIDEVEFGIEKYKAHSGDIFSGFNNNYATEGNNQVQQRDRHSASEENDKQNTCDTEKNVETNSATDSPEVGFVLVEEEKPEYKNKEDVRREIIERFKNKQEVIDVEYKEVVPQKKINVQTCTSNKNTETHAASRNVTVDSVKEASMSGNERIEDDNPNVINLGFGVTIDMNKLNNVSEYKDVDSMQQQYNDQGTRNIFFETQQENIYLQHLEQQQAGFGRHKVDVPIKEKPQVKKADEDKVNVDLEKINVETNPPKKPPFWPSVVSNELPKADKPEQQEMVSKFDNSYLKDKFRYLADIEEIALRCGVQVQMLERLGVNGMPSGLISCVVFTGESYPNVFKGFTIDTGVIIDRRAKVFPAILEYGYEDLQAYPVLIPKQEKGAKQKSKNVINERLFVDLFIGGINNLNEKDGMYTSDYLRLNKFVALISMPTNNMNGDIRKSVRNRLKAAMDAGVFEEALKHDPNSRWRFDSFDRATRSFVLTNAGTPYRFGQKVSSSKRVDISFGPTGKTSILT